MIALAFLQWWYGPGWVRLARGIVGAANRLLKTLSVPLLLRTLFAPWRRIITYGDNSIIEGMKAMVDNAVSRAVGFGVRIIVLLTALLGLVGLGVAGIVLVALWPALPLISIGLIVWGLMP